MYSDDHVVVGHGIDKDMARQLWELQRHYQLTIRDEDGVDIIEHSYDRHFLPSRDDSDVVGVSE